MAPMTNPILPDHDAVLDAELRALAPVGGKPRPVKVVELPVFRAARARLDSPFIALRVPVVALNRIGPAPTGRCCSGARTLIAPEAA